MTPKIRRIALVAASALALLGPAPDAMAIEEPAYEVVARQEPFELRRYAPYLVAETMVEGAFDDVGSEGFRRLFGYISGNNKSAEKIAMTAPVEHAGAPEKIAMTAPVTQQSEGSRWRIAFVLPAAYAPETAPRPLDDRVRIAVVAARLVAVVRYSGTWSQANYGEHLEALRRYIRDQRLAVDGEPVFARYDPPFMPWFLRRNEIMIAVRQ